MKQKYFPLTFLGAGILGALYGLIFCMVFLHVTGLDRPPFLADTWAPFSIYFSLIPTSVSAAIVTSVTYMLCWYLLVLLPNRMSVERGILVGLVGTACAIPLVEIFLDMLHGSHMSIFVLDSGMVALFGVAAMSFYSVFLLGGGICWLYVLLVRKMFALNGQLLPPLQ
jgi:hypothetical protein